MFIKIYLMRDPLLEKVFITLKCFKKSLSDRFPQNRILSHDLLEGCYLRSGYVSDVSLYERPPVII